MSWRPRPRSWAWATEVNRFTVVVEEYPATLKEQGLGEFSQAGRHYAAEI
jgi:hypothetical protein